MKAISIRDTQGDLLVLLGILAFLNWPVVLLQIFPQVHEEILPSPLNLLPGLFAWLILAKIYCPYSRLLGYVWLLWYCVGTLHTLASSIVLGSYYSNLDLHEATQIFLWGSVFYLLGLFAYEKLFANNKNAIYSSGAPTTNIHLMLRIALLSFPFAWLSSMYLTLGYIPILRGVSIVDEMYEIGYGPLYPYGACIVISILYAGYSSMVAKSNWRRATYAFIALAFILISMADGKRAFAMVAIGGLVGISLRLLQQRTWTRTFPVLVGSMIVMYVGILLLRVGDSHSMTFDVYSRLMFIGVEFRDFVYTVNSFEPGEIENYSWATSTLASMTNNLVLQAFGLEKSALTNLDSAHAWSAIWGTNLGIRTGIVSELWFAYGVIAMPSLFLFGLMSGFIIKRLRTLAGVRGVLFTAAIFGLLLLSITSQSTFTAGVLPVFLYLYVLMRVGGYLLSPTRMSVASHA